MKNHLTTIWTVSLLAVLVFSGCSHSSPNARTTPATESIKGQYITDAQLVDAGNTTPEAALETLFWATASGNYDALTASFAPRVRKEVRGWYGDKAQFAVNARGFSTFFKNLQILARKTVADDKVELKYHLEKLSSRPGQTTTNHVDVTKIATLVRIGSAWEFPDNESRSYETNWDEGSQAEPQP
jgi:hypothetical protein